MSERVHDEQPRTFRASHDARVGLIRRDWIGDDGAWVVWAEPIRTEVEGGTRISIGFPALILTGCVDNAEEVARRVAQVLTEAKL